MSDIGLTQEQIDAMLGGGAAPAAAFTEAQIKALAEVEQEFMANLPSVLNAMTGFTLELADVAMSTVTLEELTTLLGEDLLFCCGISAGEDYQHCLVLDPKLAKLVAAKLTGTEVGEDLTLSDMEMSAINEVVSQANGTYLTNLAAKLKGPATGESITASNLDELAAKFETSPAVMATLNLTDGGETLGVKHLMSQQLAKRILDVIAPEPVPEPAPVPAAEPAATVQAAPAVAAGEPVIPPVSSGSIATGGAEYQPAAFSQLAGGELTTDIRNLDILLDVPLQVTVELGKTLIPIRQILEYGQGSLITLDKLAGEPIDLLVNGKYFAKGEVVVIDENFGVRITSILSPQERIAQLS